MTQSTLNKKKKKTPPFQTLDYKKIYSCILNQKCVRFTSTFVFTSFDGKTRW